MVSRTEVDSIDVRADRAQFALHGCLVRRRLELIRVLKAFPPTEGMIHVVRQSGEVVFDAPPPTADEWRLAADSMQDSSFWQSDVGIEALWDVEGRLEGLRYAHAQCRRELDAVQSALDERVNAFVAHGGGNSHTATLAVLHHRRCVLAARHAAQPVPDLADVFREVLCALERPFTDLPALTGRVHAAAAHLERFLESHESVWKDEHCTNVATDPWKMDANAVDEAVRVMQSRFVGVATIVDQNAWALRNLAEEAAEAEYDALLTGLSRRMNKLEHDIGELMEKEAEDEGKRFRHGPELDRIANERDTLQAAVVEPLLRRYAEKFFPMSADDPDWAKDGYIPEEAWADFHDYGRRSRADHAEFVHLHADAQAALATRKQQVAADLAPKRWRYYVLGTLTAVQQHLAAAWQVRRRLTAPDHSVASDEPVRPEQLVAAFGEIVDAEYWRGTPRSAESFADCLAFLFEWFAIGPLQERYLAALATPEPDPNAPKARAVQRVGAPLPDLHAVAALLATRANRAREMVTLARLASSGSWMEARASVS